MKLKAIGYRVHCPNGWCNTSEGGRFVEQKPASQQCPSCGWWVSLTRVYEDTDALDAEFGIDTAIREMAEKKGEKA